jgi:small redox-active disulfide protein 2
MSIKTIEIIGPGCAKCKALEATTREAVKRLGLQCDVAKVSSMEEIIQRGVMATPALAVDGKVVLSGRAPSASEVEKLLTQGGVT